MKLTITFNQLHRYNNRNQNEMVSCFACGRPIFLFYMHASYVCNARCRLIHSVCIMALHFRIHCMSLDELNVGLEGRNGDFNAYGSYMHVG